MYGTSEQLAKMGVLERDQERSKSWEIVRAVLRRVDAAFVEKALTSDVELDWMPLAEDFSSPKRQTEMRKAVAKLLTKHSDYKNITNPTKAIKMAAEAVQKESEARAVAQYQRFTTVLTDYFAHKKAYFGHEVRRTTIAYRIVHVNFPIYLENLHLMKQYAQAGLDLQNKFTFAYLEVNGYNKCLVQSQIDYYNKAVGQINKQLRRLYTEHQLPEVLKGVPLKLKALQKQVLSAGEEKPVEFGKYADMQAAVQGLQKELAQRLSALEQVFSQCEEELQEEFAAKQEAVTEAEKALLFREQNAASIVSIKDYLTAALALRRFIKQVLREERQEYSEAQARQSDDALVVKESSQADAEAKQRLSLACSEAWEILANVPELYAKVRNYLTRKPYKQDKIRLFFDCAAFGKGWDVNKEAAYLVTLFRREGHYYLGIRRQGAKIDFEALAAQAKEQEPCYEKMVYKAFDFIKGMPAVVFSKMVLQKFVDGASEVVLEGEQFGQPLVVTRADFEQKYYVEKGKLREREPEDVPYLKQYLSKTGDVEGYKAAVAQRIELAKRFLKAYKAFSFFDMSKLKATQNYDSWTEFITHVNEFTYGLSWQKIPEASLKQLVEAGDLFLFRLENKDFLREASEKVYEDEQTQLWRALFSELNREERILKLLGGVEVYFRPASAPAKVSHKQGSIIVNKIDSKHNPLPAELVGNISQYLNGKTKELLPKAAQLMAQGKVKWKKAAQDIIKDKRYTQDQMLAHFPIAINYRCASNDYSFNKDLREVMHGNSDFNILAVHLGGSALAEVVIVNQLGKLIYQQVYNEFNNYNYYKALMLREEARQQAQRNWLQMEKIKNLRQGFMAALTNEVCKLILKHNSIVVLEDFSKSKGIRGAAPKLYMQFALNLLHKLNYLVLREIEPRAPGGLLQGYQLAPKVVSLAGFANQIGCVFFALPSNGEGEPEDASEAYLLALKGCLMVQRIHQAQSLDKVDFMLTQKQWLSFLKEQGFSS
ncbi:MAG: type V CRISPR-associated protein Cas12a/Cpf1 [Phascolarctobacterium sp.]